MRPYSTAVEFHTILVAVCLIGIVAVVGYYVITDSDETPIEFEVELQDGTIYQCHSWDSNKQGSTYLHGVDGNKHNTVKVMTHLIVRCTRL